MLTQEQSEDVVVSPSLVNARVGTVLVSLWYCSMGWLATFFAEPGRARVWEGLAATGIGLVVWLLIWRGHWRWAARWLVVSAVMLTLLLGWLDASQPTASRFVLLVLVVFAGWTLGMLEGALAAAGTLMIGIATVYVSQGNWERVLLTAYVLLFLLGITWLMQQGYRRHLAELRASMDALEAHKKQLNVLFQAVEQSTACVLIVDVSLGSVVYANQVYRQRSGRYYHDESGQVAGKGMTPGQHAQMWASLKAQKTWSDVVHIVLADGRLVVDDVSVSPVRNEQGALVYLVETRIDITEKMEAESRIRHLQHFDSLTQLASRPGLMQTLDELLQEQSSEAGLYREGHDWHSLLLVEIDRFQNFENVRSRPWTDHLLQAFAARLKAMVPEAVSMARIRGSLFAVVMRKAGPSRHQARMSAYAMAQDLQKGLSFIQLTGFPEGAEAVQLACSVGFTVFPFVEDGLTADSGDHVLRRAAVALSQAKHQGGDQVHAYSEALDENMQRRMTIEKELFVAIQEGQLRTFLQPQVDMHGKVLGAEALVRWKHPDKGMISPGEFIPVAEDCGLIVSLGDWMLDQVCLLLNDPRLKTIGCSLSVNVSSLQFRQMDFEDKVKQALLRSGANARQLTLEVTESLLLCDVDQVVQKMANLQALGVQFALDDFGTGYSSLAYLMRLPIQELKLDQVFIRELRSKPENRVLIESILMLAKAKKLRVVAEGVEELEQAELLRALEPSILCQGYWFSRPMPAQEWLADPDLAHRG